MGESAAYNAWIEASINGTFMSVPDTNVTIVSQYSRFTLICRSFGVFFQIFFSLWNGFIAFLASFMLIGQITAVRSGIRSVPDIIMLGLLLEALQCSLRFLYVVVDPIWINGVYPSYIHGFFVTAFPAFTMMAVL